MRSFFARNRVALVLSAVALAIGAVTILIYPRVPSLSVQGAVQHITVVGPLTPSSVDITEAPNPGGGIGLTVLLRAAEPEIGVDVSQERLLVAVVSPVPTACPPQALGCSAPQGARTITYGFPPQSWEPAGTSSITDYRFDVTLTVHDLPGVAPNLTQDSQDVVTLLPPVSALLYVAAPDSAAPVPSYFSTPPLVDYGEQIANAGDYTWEQGSIPVEYGGVDRWVYPAASSDAEILSPTFYSGTDLAQKDWNSTLTFLAGILLGLAGGVLMAAFQVAITKDDT